MAYALSDNPDITAGFISTGTQVVTNPGSQADFATRSTAPGVLRSFHFNDASQLGSNMSQIVGPNYGFSVGEIGGPVIDSQVFCSGSGSLRFDIPGNTGDNASGSWFTNFSTDLNTQFGANSEFYVQWRQRFNQAFCTTFFTESGGIPQGGIKQAIVTTGDQPAGAIYNSCEAIGCVIQTYYQRRLPISYNSCTGSASHGPYSGFYESAAGDYRLQNGTAPYCLYTASGDGTPTGVGPGCFSWVPDEWMTFKVWIKLGARNDANTEWDNSEFKLWGARDGQASQLLIWWRPGVGGYFPLAAGPTAQNQKFGKVFLLPFMTNKDRTQSHPLCQTWYDELIISTQDIADPGTSAPNTASYPAWRRNQPVSQWLSIAGTSGMNGAVAAAIGPGSIDAWCGFAATDDSFWSAASSGHAAGWWNPVLRIDLTADTPRWVEKLASSPSSAYTNTRYYTDNHPCSRHTYNSTQWVKAAHSFDGKEHILLVNAYATASTGIPNTYTAAPNVEGYQTAANMWDSVLGVTWTDVVWFNPIPATTRDPRTGWIYTGGDYTAQVYKPNLNTSTLIQGRPGFRDTGMDDWSGAPSLVDVTRDKVVALIDGRPNNTAGGVRLQRYTIASPYTLDTITVTGALTAMSIYNGMVHDLDNDRYLYFHNDGKVYSINPATGASVLLSTVAAPLNTTQNRMAYFQNLGGVAYLPTYASPMLFLPTR